MRDMHGKIGGFLLLGVLVFLACAAPDTKATPTEEATATSTFTPATTPTPQASPTPGENIPFSTYGWKTNFSKHSVPLSEFMSGGPPRDGIPPIDKPKFVSIAEAEEWLKDQEPVISFELGGVARAYPLQILIYHEIVNDWVEGEPVLITFCPLCNTAIAFNRRLEGVVYDFGTSGKLRHSDLVMWDRQTESWWQQITGEAIVGELTGKRLDFLPATIISWRDFKESFPQSQVLSRETGFYVQQQRYGTNPDIGYDEIDKPPFLFKGVVDGRLSPMERVVTVTLDDMDVAYPFSILEEVNVINDRVGDQDIVVFHKGGTASAVDRYNIADSQDVGAAAVYSRIVEGEKLTFFVQGEDFMDQETKSTWNILGQAIGGPLSGKKLEPVLHANHFWFAWAAFKPDTRIYQ